MSVSLTIGDFARMTHLSVKALRHYHELGVLIPARVDKSSGYRLYDLNQVSTAQVIRRLRDLGMPLDELRFLIQTEDISARNRVIVGHLSRMENQLSETQAVVRSLRALLNHPSTSSMQVEYRRVGPQPSIVIRETVAVSDFAVWCGRAFRELRAALRGSNAERTNADAALYSAQFFEEALGEVVAFIPIRGQARPTARIGVEEIPGAELAIVIHDGPLEDLDQAYAALGAHVAARAIGVEGPIREHYLVTPFETHDRERLRTEVGWPVFMTGG